MLCRGRYERTTKRCKRLLPRDIREIQTFKLQCNDCTTLVLLNQKTHKTLTRPRLHNVLAHSMSAPQKHYPNVSLKHLYGRQTTRKLILVSASRCLSAKKNAGICILHCDDCTRKEPFEQPASNQAKSQRAIDHTT